ncbi:porin [Shimia sagamensis]|uniref:Porin n=1 Tax=Shimia sagamensis TaxID=1566352 RepID=A0ABY1PGF0_9RHOB|nr:porin [Shimia sagamensis]SMP33566.1 porin [Shimia sagamensis]
MRTGNLFFGVAFAACAASVAVSQQKETPSQGFAVYGQINRGVLRYDDGPTDHTYWFVDNSKSVSRLGATFDTPLENGWRLHARGEIALKWKETNAVNRNDPHDEAYKFDRTELRKLEVGFVHDTFGRITLGQGAMSADGITGLDLSLTTVVAGTPVQDAAGGQFLVPNGAYDPSNKKIKQAFRSMGSSRRLRLRFDAPINNGWQFVAAAGQEVLSYNDDQLYADTSLRYDGDHGDFRIRAGGAFRWIEERPNVAIASGSLLHRPSGWNVTLATGHETSGANYYYGKIGYIGRWFDIGQTAISIDMYDGDDIYQNRSSPVQSSSSRSYGIAIVQKIKSPKIDLYALLRRYEYTDSTAQYQDSLALLAGARWTF